MKYCENCKLEYDDIVTFCGNCGEKLEYEIIYQEEIIENSNTPSDNNTGKNFAVGCIAIVIIALIIGFGGCALLEANRPEPKKFEDYTNKDMDAFLKWKQNEQQRQKDSERFFK